SSVARVWCACCARTRATSSGRGRGMARLAGVDLPRNKRMEIALTYIHGIGRSAALKLCAEAQVDPGRKSDDLTDEETTRLRRAIDAGFKVEGDLRRDVAAEGALDLVAGVDRASKTRRLLVGQVVALAPGIDLRLGAQLERRAPADAVDVGEGELHALVS